MIDLAQVRTTPATEKKKERKGKRGGGGEVVADGACVVNAGLGFKKQSD